MTKTVFYKKVGRRYQPVAEYDNAMMDALPRGNHLLSVHPGGASRRYNVDPAYAPMIAAGRVAEDTICRSIQKAAELRPKRTPLTPGQKAAWENLAREFGDELSTLHGLSIRDCAEAGVKAMQTEADKLLEHPSVQMAYNHFMLVCKLAQTSK
jgi:hypothetical protein